MPIDLEGIYTKAEYTKDIAECMQLKQEALQAVAQEQLDGFELWKMEATIKEYETSCKQRWGRSQGLLGALKINTIKLAQMQEGAERAALARKVRYLKMLAGKILAGSPKPEPREPLGSPKVWPWVKMINGWQQVSLE